VTDPVGLARQILPNLPTEVFDGWFIERIKTAGWPPTGARWNALLGGYSIEEWSTFVWQAEDVDLHSIPLSVDSAKNIVGLSQAQFSGVRNAYSNIENSQSRMKNIYFHISKTRQLPGRVVLIAGSDSWEIIDGCHRVTMYEGWLRHPDLKERIDRMQPAWVARMATTHTVGAAGVA